MKTPTPDQRDARRRALDEQIAGEPQLPPLSIPEGTSGRPIEAIRPQLPSRRPVAIVGIVENGLVRPLDSDFPLRENSRVVIVATEEG
jgi:hypothetical protein